MSATEPPSAPLQQVEAGQDDVIPRLVPCGGKAGGIAPPGALAGAISLSDDFDAPVDGLLDANLFPADGGRGTSAA
jgi:hypothetical protein